MPCHPNRVQSPFKGPGQHWSGTTACATPDSCGLHPADQESSAITLPRETAPGRHSLKTGEAGLAVHPARSGIRCRSPVQGVTRAARVVTVRAERDFPRTPCASAQRCPCSRWRADRSAPEADRATLPPRVSLHQRGGVPQPVSPSGTTWCHRSCSGMSRPTICCAGSSPTRARVRPAVTATGSGYASSTSRAPEARGGATDGELVPDVEDPFPAGRAQPSPADRARRPAFPRTGTPISP